MFAGLKQHRWRFTRFAAVGVLNTVIDFGVFYALTQAGIWPLAANVISFSAAVINSYILNKYWTFGHKTKPGAKEFRNFAAVTVIGLALSSLTIYALAEAIGVYIAKAASIIITMMWNYIGAHVVFKQEEGA